MQGSNEDGGHPCTSRVAACKAAADFKSELIRRDRSAGQISNQEGSITTRAAVAFEARGPLEILEIELARPQVGEVLIEIMATGICHADAHTLDGLDSKDIFRSILGHE